MQVAYAHGCIAWCVRSSAIAVQNGEKPVADYASAQKSQAEIFEYKTTVSLPVAAEVDRESVVAPPGVPGLVRDIGSVECVWADDTPRDYVAKLVLQRQRDLRKPDDI